MIQIARLLAALALCVVAVLGTSHMPVAAEDGGSETFLSNPTDGHLRLGGDDGWEPLRDSREADEVFDDLRYIKINTRPDIIYRGFLFSTHLRSRMTSLSLLRCSISTPSARET